MTNLDAARKLLAVEVAEYRRVVLSGDSDFTASIEIAAALRAIAAARSQAMREAAEIAKQHQGWGKRERERKGQKLSMFDPEDREIIRAEENGGDIVASVITGAILATLNEGGGAGMGDGTTTAKALEIAEDLRSKADCDARAGEPLGKCMREAAAFIESQCSAISLCETIRESAPNGEPLTVRLWPDGDWDVFTPSPSVGDGIEREGWQDISSAPKDGTRILVFTSWPMRTIYSARWIDSPHNRWQADAGGEVARASQWMPFPDPPALTQKDSSS